MIPQGFGSALLGGVVPPHGRSAAYKFAGFTREEFVDEDGLFRRDEYERKYITRIDTPQPLVYAGKRITRIAAHIFVAGYLRAALEQIATADLWHVINVYGGGFEPRMIRGGADWSMHTFGLALDFDPDRNPLGAAPEQTRIGNTSSGRELVSILEAWGFFWGGHFDGRKDCQHFQWVTGC
jgi:hypothetical protein